MDVQAHSQVRIGRGECFFLRKWTFSCAFLGKVDFLACFFSKSGLFCVLLGRKWTILRVFLGESGLFWTKLWTILDTFAPPGYEPMSWNYGFKEFGKVQKL